MPIQGCIVTTTEERACAAGRKRVSLLNQIEDFPGRARPRMGKVLPCQPVTKIHKQLCEEVLAVFAYTLRAHAVCERLDTFAGRHLGSTPRMCGSHSPTCAPVPDSSCREACKLQNTAVGTEDTFPGRKAPHTAAECAPISSSS